MSAGRLRKNVWVKRERYVVKGACRCTRVGQVRVGFPKILLVMEDDTEERTVHMDATIIVQEAQFPELIHKETHP